MVFSFYKNCLFSFKKLFILLPIIGLLQNCYYCYLFFVVFCTKIIPYLHFLNYSRTFNWALSMGGKVPVSEGLEHTDLPDGTGEFLDAWLMLVEKMVNPSTVLDSPHSLPAKMPGITPTMPQFSALRFLIVTQKVSICKESN